MYRRACTKCPVLHSHLHFAAIHTAAIQPWARQSSLPSRNELSWQQAALPAHSISPTAHPSRALWYPQAVQVLCMLGWTWQTKARSKDMDCCLTLWQSDFYPSGMQMMGCPAPASAPPRDSCFAGLGACSAIAGAPSRMPWKRVKTLTTILCRFSIHALKRLFHLLRKPPLHHCTDWPCPLAKQRNLLEPQDIGAASCNQSEHPDLLQTSATGNLIGNTDIKHEMQSKSLQGDWWALTESGPHSTTLLNPTTGTSRPFFSPSCLSACFYLAVF